MDARSPVGQGVPHARSASYPVRDGNDVELLIDAEESFRAIGEAVATATRSVWVSVAFIAPWFRFPDGHGLIFDLFRTTARRGVDVRILAWRPDPAIWSETNVLEWEQDILPLLTSDRSTLSIRWDSLPGLACHHQKMWLIDAGLDDQVAFIGGINLTARSLHRRGHPGTGQSHDLYAQVRGPAVVDVHHNFVQRWNEASEWDTPRGSMGDRSQEPLDFPTVVASARGSSLVQIQRTVPAGRYRDKTPAPGTSPFSIGEGEWSNLEQHLNAINAATSAIYIENQAVPVAEILDALRSALDRGVRVALVVPAAPTGVIAVAGNPDRQALIDRLIVLRDHPSFALVGLAGLGSDGRRHPVYVHSKAMLVDDLWATVGSCNLHEASLHRNTELNVSIWDEVAVRRWRTRLIDELTGIQSLSLASADAVAMLHATARHNAALGQAWAGHWSGLAFELDAASYGVSVPIPLA